MGIVFLNCVRRPISCLHKVPPLLTPGSVSICVHTPLEQRKRFWWHGRLSESRLRAGTVEEKGLGVPRYEPAKVRLRRRNLIEYHDRSVVPDASLRVLRRPDL